LLGLRSGGVKQLAIPLGGTAETGDPTVSAPATGVPLREVIRRIDSLLAVDAAGTGG
jgi:hypothetical protein